MGYLIFARGLLFFPGLPTALELRLDTQS